MTRKKLFRIAFLSACVLIVGIGVIAPLLNAGRFRAQIQRALESALNRRVSMGKVYFNVFTGPGFTVEDVLIQEAPGMGIEPFAHVASLKARVRLAGLWSGNLSFSNLKLDEPSVNIVKSDAGPWNVQALADTTAKVNPGALASVPDIEIRNGRLNFKFGSTKSVFYLSNADVDVYSNDRGELILRFSGEPTRTDHLAQGLGLLVARGVLRTNPASLDMSVQLERTAIPELARLFDIQDTGVRGSVASNLKLNGPLNKVNISGNLRIEDIHRWDLIPNKGEGWTLNYAGLWNALEQRIEVETRSEEQESPVSGKFTAANYLSAPKWEAEVSFRDLPAAGLVDTARHMGAPFPQGATLDGKVNGKLSYARPEGVKGELFLADAALKFPQGGSTEFALAPLVITGNQVRFGPADLRDEGAESAQVLANYALDTRALQLDLSTKGLGVAQTKALVARLLGAGSVPLLEHCRQGSWKGSLVFAKRDEEPGEWTGDLELSGTQIDVPGLAAPLRLTSAAVLLQSGGFSLTRMRGHAGTIPFEGDYRASEKDNKADRIRLVFGELPLAELERLLRPTLSRQQGFLARALRLDPAPLPDWLRSRDLEGTVQAREVNAGDVPLGSLRGRLDWNGAAVQIAGLETKLGSTESSGRLLVSLKGGSPTYRFVGQVHGISYRDGVLDVDGAWESRGSGMGLLKNARGAGSLSGRSIALAPDVQVDEISGDYRLEAGPDAPRLTLSKLQVTQGQEVLHGQGSAQADGRLVLELMAGRRPVRLTGMLLPAHPSPAP